MAPSTLAPIASLIRTENRTHASQAGSVDPSATVTHFSTKWLNLSTISYRFQHDTPNTYPRDWDVASRHNAGEGPEAVVVLAKMKLEDERVLLVKQFRPPLNAVSIELPAGLIDKGETYETAALRELKEETGFVGTVVRTHGPASLSPGLSSERVVLVEVRVDGEGEQACEVSENIEVVSVPLGRLEEAVEYMVSTEACVVMHAVSSLAVGLRIGQMLDA